MVFAPRIGEGRAEVRKGQDMSQPVHDSHELVTGKSSCFFASGIDGGEPPMPEFGFRQFCEKGNRR
jgi:hypothetical protein